MIGSSLSSAVPGGRKLRALLAVAGAFGALALAAPGAQAAIAGAPSYATTNPAGSPDLIGVVVTRYARNTLGLPTQVEWCFDRTINPTTPNGTVLPVGAPGTAAPAETALFSITGYARSRNVGTGGGGVLQAAQLVRPDSLFLDPNVGPLGTGPNTCVIGNFNGEVGTSPTQARSFTVGSVHGGAVANNLGVPNIGDSHGLGPSDATGPAGETTGPNILQIFVDTGNRTISYVFDHDISLAGAIDPHRFFFYDQTGTPTFGVGIVNIANNVVTVQFPTGVPSTLPINALVGVAGGTVKAADGNASAGSSSGEFNQTQTIQGTNPSAPGLALTTSHPGLIGASAVAGVPNTVDFTFDHQIAFAGTGCGDVGFVCPHAFHLYNVNNQAVATGVAAAQASPANPNIVRVTFGTTVNGNGPGGVPCGDTCAAGGSVINLALYTRAEVDGVGPAPLGPTGPAPHTGGSGTNAAGIHVGPPLDGVGVFNAGNSAPNITSTAPLNPSASAPNFTSAPDITGIVRNPNLTQADITFDQAFASGTGTIIPVCMFHAVSSGSTLGNTPTAATITGSNKITVFFSNTGDIGIANPAIQFDPTCGGSLLGPLASGNVLGEEGDIPVIQTVAFPAGTAGLRTDWYAHHVVRFTKSVVKKVAKHS